MNRLDYLADDVADGPLPLFLAVVLAITLLAVPCCTGCTEADRRSSELSKDADSFGVTRRVTVIDTRSDRVLWQLTGNFSVKQSAGDIDIICAIDGGYTKHFFRLNDDTVYIVEDLTGTDVRPYTYRLEFLPEEVEDVTIGGA